MGNNDFLDNVGDDFDPNETPGFKEFAPGWHDFVCEVLDIERKQTKDETGELVSYRLRVCDKEYLNRQIFDQWFIDTKDDSKKEGAKIGAQSYAKMINACGYVFGKSLKDDKVKKGLQIGVLQELDKKTFKDENLKGRFFLAGVFVPSPDPMNPDKPVYPEHKNSKMIDPEDYDNIVKSIPAKKQKAEKSDSEDGGFEPPF